MKKKILIFDCDSISINELLGYITTKVGLQILRPRIVSDKDSFRKEIMNQSWDIIVINFCAYYFWNLEGKKLPLFVADVKKRQPDVSYFLASVGSTYQKSQLEKLGLLAVHKKYDEEDLNKVFGLIKLDTSKVVSIDYIRKMVCEKQDVPYEKVAEKTRKRKIVRARQIIMFLSKMFTKHSLKFIGNEFGGRDHTTVIHSCKIVKDLMDTDDNIKNEVEKFIYSIAS